MQIEESEDKPCPAYLFWSNSYQRKAGLPKTPEYKIESSEGDYWFWTLPAARKAAAGKGVVVDIFRSCENATMIRRVWIATYRP